MKRAKFAQDFPQKPVVLDSLRILLDQEPKTDVGPIYVEFEGQTEIETIQLSDRVCTRSTWAYTRGPGVA